MRTAVPWISTRRLLSSEKNCKIIVDRGRGRGQSIQCIHDEQFAVIWRRGVNWFELRDADVRCTVSWQGTTSAAAAAATVDDGGGGGGSPVSVCDEPCVRRSTRGTALRPIALSAEAGQLFTTAIWYDEPVRHGASRFSRHADNVPVLIAYTWADNVPVASTDQRRDRTRCCTTWKSASGDVRKSALAHLLAPQLWMQLNRHTLIFRSCWLQVRPIKLPVILPGRCLATDTSHFSNSVLYLGDVRRHSVTIAKTCHRDWRHVVTYVNFNEYIHYDDH